MTTATAMSSELRRVIRAATVAVFALLLLPASAAEPPARVGRISFTQGDVAFFMDQTEGWQAARLNFPVTGENSLSTESGGRAEVRIGASAVSMDDRSLLDVIALQDEQTALFLRHGILNIRLRLEDPNARAPSRVDGDFRVETNEGIVSLSRHGSYRIESVEGRAETRISVFSGRARFESGGNPVTIDSGKALVVRKQGVTDEVYFEAARAGGFDQWADARDHNSLRVYTRYSEDRIVSTAMTGYDDLDEHGDWIDDSEYGRLWTPRVIVSDWAPYRYGHWAYVQPWGWTWVDDAAWGFAPFHYGRWVYVSARSRWSWWPGPYVRRPIYAPALVGWLNRPAPHSRSAWGSSVGWFPLAPREHFVPGYSNNIRYIRNLNQLTENGGALRPPTRYANHHGGATVVPQDAFQGGRGMATQRTRHPQSVIAAQTPGNDANFVPRFNRGPSATPSPIPRPTPTFAPNVAITPVAPAPVAVTRPRPTPSNRPTPAADAAIEDRGSYAPPRIRRERPPSERAQPAAPSAPTAPTATSNQERHPSQSNNRPDVRRELPSKPVVPPVVKATPTVSTTEAKPEGKHPQKEVDRQ